MNMPATQAVAPDENDHGLAEKVAAGDLAAFEQIMRRNNRMLYRVARAILKDDTEAEDCLQSAYLLVFRSIASYKGQAKLSTWIGRIVINEALARKRKAARVGEVVPIDAFHDLATPVDSALTTGRTDPESAAMSRELGSLIERRIDALPEAFRAVFVMRALEELSVDETAALLDIPPATVRSRYFRARSMLRESLAREVDAALDSAFEFAGSRCNRVVASVLQLLPLLRSPRGG